MIRQLISNYQLRHSDYIFLSFPKSGRTWIRSILKQYLSVYYDISAPDSSNPFRRIGKRRRIPLILFTHAYPRSRDFRRTAQVIDKLYGRPVILQVRDPRAVVFAYYFQVNKRTNVQEAKSLNFQEFVHHPVMGIDRIIRFMNTVYDTRCKFSKFSMTRHEDNLTDTFGELTRLLRFLEIPVDTQILERVIRQTPDTTRAIESGKLPQLETSSRDTPPGPRPTSGQNDKANEYTDYLETEDLEYLERCMQTLNPVFGYHNII